MREADATRCAAVLDIVKSIRWTKVVYKTYENNQGFSLASMTAIDWFLENEPEGIILEDDCVASPTFYSFAAEMLQRFRHQENVRFVSGHNPLGMLGEYTSSYFFTQTPYIWGWATWKHKWIGFDSSLAAWKSEANRDAVRARMGVRYFNLMRRYWQSIFDCKLDSWDIALHFDLVLNGHLAAMPRKNLVTNIGFSNDATNNSSGWPNEYRQSRYVLGNGDLDLIHPDLIRIEANLEEAIFRNRFPLVRRFAENFPPRVREDLRRLSAWGRTLETCVIEEDGHL
jgi:hypothetical protein